MLGNGAFVVGVARDRKGRIGKRKDKATVANFKTIQHCLTDNHPDRIDERRCVAYQFYLTAVGHLIRSDEQPLRRQRHRHRRGFAPDQVGALLGDHHGCCVGVGRRHARHHRSVNHPQILQAVDPELVADHT